VQVEDGGQYSLLATNKWGDTTSMAAEMDVLMVPLVARQPESVLTLVGCEVALAVTAVGQPPLTCKWYNGDNEVDMSRVRILKGDEDAPWSWVMRKASIDDGGLYTAKISNKHGSSLSKRVDVTVGSPPVIETNLHHREFGIVECNIGETLELQLGVRGTLPMSFVWFHSRLTHSCTLSSPRLVIESAQLSDGGEYVCRVGNEFGFQMSFVVVVRVKGRFCSRFFKARGTDPLLGGECSDIVLTSSCVLVRTGAVTPMSPATSVHSVLATANERFALFGAKAHPLLAPRNTKQHHRQAEEDDDEDTPSSPRSGVPSLQELEQGLKDEESETEGDEGDGPLDLWQLKQLNLTRGYIGAETLRGAPHLQVPNTPWGKGQEDKAGLAAGSPSTAGRRASKLETIRRVSLAWITPSAGMRLDEMDSTAVMALISKTPMVQVTATAAVKMSMPVAIPARHLLWKELPPPAPAAKERKQAGSDAPEPLDASPIAGILERKSSTALDGGPSPDAVEALVAWRNPHEALYDILCKVGRNPVVSVPPARRAIAS
jgi:hypothetical protein